MQNWPRILLGAALLALTLGAPAVAADSNPGSAGSPQMPKKFHFNESQSLDVDYLLFLPKDYAAGSAKRWPLILFLHGAGERGTDVWAVATHGPPKYVKDHPDFPFIVVSPQCPAGQTWSNDRLLALLDDIQQNYAVDPARVYLTGLSMGGYGSWSLGLAHPERFAAIVPICGGGEMINLLLSNSEKPKILHSLGIWAFHGAKDSVVPLAESQRMVDAAKRVGITEVKFTVYPEADHNSWTETYNNPELYQWLLQHERKR